MSQHIPQTPVPYLSKDVNVAIVRAEWNGHITGPLADGAAETLRKYGIPDNQIGRYDVPGAVELTFAASQLIESELYDAVIAVGCVIKGDTPHFDYVCQSVTQGITALNADCDIPVIFCVLTVLDEQQAMDRCGGSAGHKGVEAAETALKMVAFKRRLESI